MTAAKTAMGAVTIAGMINGGSAWWLVTDTGDVLRGRAEPCQPPQIGCAPTDTVWVAVGNVLAATGESSELRVAGAGPSLVLSNGDQFNASASNEGIGWLPAGNVFVNAGRPVGTMAWYGNQFAVATSVDAFLYYAGGWHYLKNLGQEVVETLRKSWGQLKVTYR